MDIQLSARSSLKGLIEFNQNDASRHAITRFTERDRRNNFLYWCICNIINLHGFGKTPRIDGKIVLLLIKCKQI